jgi:hypothetical protein
MNRRQHLTWLGVLGSLLSVGCSSSEPSGTCDYGYGRGCGYGYGYGFANALGPSRYKNLAPSKVVAVKRNA